MLYTKFSLFPTYQVFVTAVMALFLMVILTPLLIHSLQRRNVGQFVREDGPPAHLTKSGTPNLGGVLFILVLILLFAVVSKNTFEGWVVVFAITAYGMIGFFDDMLKVVKERALGLRARAKLGFEVLLTLLLGVIFSSFLHLPPTIKVPVVGSTIDVGALGFTFMLVGQQIVVYPLFLAFIFLVFSATTNSVNLTDGLDGLAAGTVAICLLALGGIAFRQGNLDLALISTALAGACIGFLWYNSHPAKIFMGDTGSLSLGAAIASVAVLTKTELLLIIIGGIYVIEALSVIIQVLSYRYLKKRVFKMAPIHHHFEIIGWSETQIMVRFWILAGLCAGAGFSLYFIGTT